VLSRWYKKFTGVVSTKTEIWFFLKVSEIQKKNSNLNWKLKIKKSFFFEKKQNFQTFCATNFLVKKPFFKKSYPSLSTDYTFKLLIPPALHRELSNKDIIFILADI
jgi:hypothetical protein